MNQILMSVDHTRQQGIYNSRVDDGALEIKMDRDMEIEYRDPNPFPDIIETIFQMQVR